MSANKPRWETTREPNLLRNAASGRYYGRFKVARKQKWVNLGTDIWSVAKLRVADARAKLARVRLGHSQVQAGGARLGALLDIYRQRISDRVDIRPETRRRLNDEIKAILKTWPNFSDLDPAEVNRASVIEWRNRLSREGTGHRPPGAVAQSPRNNGSSASLVNKCIDALRQMLDIAIEQGQLAGNPLHARGVKLKNTPRKPKLPEAAKLAEIFGEIERGGGRFSRDSADFCRFLAYTGCRLSEARGVYWSDVDFKRGLIRVHGSKTEAAEREVPIIPAARILLERLHRERVNEMQNGGLGLSAGRIGRVLRVGEAAKSLSRACAVQGAERLTHHDLRDAFATAAIESGVDVPTVAAWLGHADGGALLMRVYSHHRRAHSVAQAAKVKI